MTQPVLLTLIMLAVFALVIGGMRTYARADRTKGVLMVVAALVLLGNVVIWIWPIGR